jgi:hypothetical protein
MSDPRKAKTLGEACMNPDGKTFNMIRLMSWLTECVAPGRGIPEEEVRAMAQEAINRRKARKGPNGTE